MKGRPFVRLCVEQELQLVNDVQSGSPATSSASLQKIIDQYEPLIWSFLVTIPDYSSQQEAILCDLRTEIYHAVRTFNPAKGTKLLTHVYRYLNGLCLKFQKKAYTSDTYIHLVEDIDNEDLRRNDSREPATLPTVEFSLDEEFLVNAMPASIRPAAKSIIADKLTQAETARLLGITRPAVSKQVEKIRTFAALILN